MFIDASYEGDLLPGAGVSFTVGRESNATYGEDYSGIQAARATKNQLPDGINPYVTPGNPASGLLPGVNPTAGGSDGDGDTGLQAFCFRMVLTDLAANRVPVAKPAGYREADYELLFRAIEAGQTSGFFKLDRMPNRKTDSNNSGGISTDYIGKNYGPGWNWTTLGHDQRLALAKQHENWQRGLIWTLQNHPRVPLSVRNRYAPWGLPADEFTDNGNWPWQLYVRETRRMVSDYVMNQRHCSGETVASDSIGLAAYSMDSHHAQRHVKNGMVKNEGDVQMTVPRPYPVSYRSIIPKSGECRNLLVPWSLSASHMAFGSIRMEPVFMILSQSAAIGADLAIRDNVGVQQVAYSKLRPALIAAGQVLGDPNAGPPVIVVDNSDAEHVALTGTWISATSTGGFIGADYLHDGNAGQGTKQVVFTPPAAVTGVQRVYLRWTSHTNRASDVPIRIIDSRGTRTILVDQKSNGGKWNLLGTFRGVRSVTLANTGAGGYVVADAVGFSPVAAEDDGHRDGLSDWREVELGPNALITNPAFLDAVRSHPDFFNLRSDSEVFDPHVGQSAYSPFQFQFGITAGPPWDFFENHPLGVSQHETGRFVRVDLRPRPAGFVSALAAGQSRTIVVYGTSLTSSGAWVGQMNSWLAAKYPGLFTVINSGLSGKNSAEGLAQLQSKVLSRNPDTVFIEFAMNDAFHYTDGTPSLSVTQAKANLEAMIQAIQRQNPQVEIILQTMNTVWNSPAGSNTSATLRPNLTDYYQMYRDVAAAHGLMLIDHLPDWATLQSSSPSTFQSYLPDGVHPTASGCSKVILPLLKWKLSGGRPLP
jgi:lysophospholipase L1-like esterase